MDLDDWQLDADVKAIDKQVCQEAVEHLPRCL